MVNLLKPVLSQQPQLLSLAVRDFLFFIAKYGKTLRDTFGPSLPRAQIEAYGQVNKAMFRDKQSFVDIFFFGVIENAFFYIAHILQCQ